MSSSVSEYIDEILKILLRNNKLRNDKKLEFNNEVKNCGLIKELYRLIYTKFRNQLYSNEFKDIVAYAEYIYTSKRFQKLRSKIKGKLQDSVKERLNDADSLDSNNNNNQVEILWTASDDDDDDDDDDGHEDDIIVNENYTNDALTTENNVTFTTSNGTLTARSLIRSKSNTPNTSGSNDSYSLLSFSTLPAYDRIHTLAEELLSSQKSSRQRYDILKQLTSFRHEDLLESDAWKLVLRGFSVCLKDRAHKVNQLALNSYIDLFEIAKKRGTACDLYISLADSVLISYKERIKTDMSNHVRVLHYMQCQLPTIWVHISTQIQDQIVRYALELMVIHDKISPFQIMANIDPTARWMHIWCMRYCMRKSIMKCLLDRSIPLVRRILKHTILFDENSQKINPSISVIYGMSLFSHWLRYGDMCLQLSSQCKKFINLALNVLSKISFSNIQLFESITDGLCEQAITWSPYEFLCEPIEFVEAIYTISTIISTSKNDAIIQTMFDMCFCILVEENSDGNNIMNEKKYSNREKSMLACTVINYLNTNIKQPMLSTSQATNLLRGFLIIHLMCDSNLFYLYENEIKHLLINILHRLEGRVTLSINYSTDDDNHSYNNWQPTAQYIRNISHLQLSIVGIYRGNFLYPDLSKDVSEVIYVKELETIWYQIANKQYTLLKTLINNSHTCKRRLFRCMLRMYRDNDSRFQPEQVEALVGFSHGPLHALQCGFIEDVIHTLSRSLIKCTLEPEPPLERNINREKRIKRCVKLLEIVYMAPNILDVLDLVIVRKDGSKRLTLWDYLLIIIRDTLHVTTFADEEIVVSDEIQKLGFNFVLNLVNRHHAYCHLFNERMQLYDNVLQDHTGYAQNVTLNEALSSPKWYDDVCGLRAKLLQCLCQNVVENDDLKDNYENDNYQNDTTNYNNNKNHDDNLF